MRYQIAFTEKWNAAPFWGVQSDDPIVKPAVGELVDLRGPRRGIMTVTGVMTGYGRDPSNTDWCYTLVLLTAKQLAATDDNPVPWPW